MQSASLFPSTEVDSLMIQLRVTSSSSSSSAKAAVSATHTSEKDDYGMPVGDKDI